MTGKKTILIAGIIAIIAAFVMVGCQNPAASKVNKTNNNGNYRVFVQPPARGTVTLDKPSGLYKPDEMVAMIIEPDEGFECSYLQAVITNAANAPIGGNLSDSIRMFRMPSANVYIYAGFALKARNSISIGEQVYGKILSISHTEAPLNISVTVTVQPDAGHELEAGGIRIVGNNTGATLTCNRTSNRNEYSFMMIPEPVTVHAFFFDPSKEQFIIHTDTAKDQSGNAVLVKGMAAAGETVTIAMYLKDDHMLLEAPLVTFKGNTLEVEQNTADPTRWTFTMPKAGTDADQIASGDSVSVKVVWKMIPMYVIVTEIGETSAGEGRFIVEGLNNAGKIAPGGDIKLALRVNDAENFYYKQGSIKAVNAADASLTSRLTFIENNWSGDLMWKFAVPEVEPATMVETLTVSAIIAAIPAHSITFAGLDDNGKKTGTIEITPVATGKDVAAGQLKVREGKTTTAVLKYDKEDYTLAAGSFKVSKTSGGEIQAQRDGETKLTFVMHPQPVTVSAGLTAKPFLTITKKNDNTGTLRLAISNSSGPKENARAGYTVAIYPVPVAGYTGANTSPVITPAVSSLKKVNDVWTFTMPSSNVSIAWEFTESGNVAIFKGGPKLAGLTVVQSAWPYGENVLKFVDWDENTSGRQAGTKAIRIGPNSKSTGLTYANAEVGFGLAVPEAVDASWAGAISFYMKRESGTQGLGNAWMGFGDGMETVSNGAIWYGDNNNQVIPVTDEWKRYIVPVPVPRDGMKISKVFFWKAYGNAVWLIDDVEFISAAQIEFDSISIPAEYPGQVVPDAPIEAYQLANFTGQIGFTYKTTRGDPASATMFNRAGTPRYNWGYWVPNNKYTYKVYGAAAELSGTTITPKTQGGSFELTLSLGQKESNKMTVNIERDDLKIVNDWEDGQGIGADNASGTGDNRYFKTFGWSRRTTEATAQGGAACGEYKFMVGGAGTWYGQQGELVAGRTFATPQDYSSYDTVSFWVQTAIQGAGTAMDQQNRYSFIFFNGGSSNNYPSATGTAHAANLLATTQSANGTWREIRVSMNNFGALNKSAITGWAVRLDSHNNGIGAGAEHILRLDTVTVQKN